MGTVRGKVMGEWRKLHNEELSDLYLSPSNVWVLSASRICNVGINVNYYEY